MIIWYDDAKNGKMIDLMNQKKVTENKKSPKTTKTHASACVCGFL